MKNISFQFILVVFLALGMSGYWSYPSVPSTTSQKTIVVNSVSDDGPGSLREAIASAVSGDSITFDPSVFPPAAPDTIFLTSELPHILPGNLTIDASDAGVVIDGSNITRPEAYGLSISSNNNIIRGLQITGFSQAGIGLNGGAQNNTIGGDRDIGTGLLGQGNLITGDGTFGIGLWGNGTSFNTIQGNFIGTDVSGTVAQGSFSGGIFSGGADYNLFEDNLIGGYLDNGVNLGGVSEGHNTVRGNYIGTDTSGMIQIAYSNSYGVSIDRSGYNVIGPDNVIAHNGLSGIIIQGKRSVGNSITQNSIHDNGLLGIEFWYGANNQLAAPVLFDFDMQAGTVTGVAYANCTVEVFSDKVDQGEIYEGRTTADKAGIFSFNKGAPFTRSRLTATATDTNGNTSQFSLYTPPDTPSRTMSIQEGNNLPKTQLQTKLSEELADNRIGGGAELWWVNDMGVKRFRMSFNGIEEDLVVWDKSEFEVTQDLDNWATSLAALGIKIHMTLSFWDKANHPGGWTEPAGYSRFQTEEEIDRYLEFVKFIVNHFKDRVEYYELWNEPDNGGFPIQHIKIPDLITLVERTVPVIKDEYPEAKVMVSAGANLIYQLDYMFDMVNQERIMSLVDVVCWHPFYGQSPADEESKDYYYQYPSIVQNIKNTAYANGFRGEYFADEVGWAVEGWPHPPGQKTYSEIQAAKYRARQILTHLGLDVTISLNGPAPYYVTNYAVIRNLCTLMAGTSPDSVSVEIQSEADSIRIYSFSSTSGEKLIALWSDGVAVDDDPGVPATLILPGLSNRTVTGIDVLNGFQQEMITEIENGNLVIRNLMVKDYPIIISSASIATNVTDRNPFTFALLQNYPNPFNSQTTITYELKKNAHMSLKIYNILGQSATTLVDEKQFEGRHSLQWNGKDQKGRDVVSGLYFYKMETTDFVKVRKMLLIR